MYVNYTQMRSHTYLAVATHRYSNTDRVHRYGSHGPQAGHRRGTMDIQSSIPAPRAKSSPAVIIARFALLAILVAGALGVLAACSTASATPTVATTTHLTFD